MRAVMRSMAEAIGQGFGLVEAQRLAALMICG